MELLQIVQVMISDPNPVLIVSLALTVAFLVAYALIRTPRGGGRNLPPSPPGLPVIGNLHQLGSLPHRSLAALSEKHGAVTLLRLGQSPTVVVSSAEAVKDIFKKHDVAFSGRPKAAASDALFYEGKNIAFSPYNEEWRQARKICTVQLLSQKRVSSFGRVRQEEVSKLVAALRSAAMPVNLTNLMMVTSNDITTRCIIGQRFSDGSGFLGDAAKKVTVLLVALSFADFFPYFGGWIDRLRGFTARLSSTARLLDAFYTQVVDEHDPTKRDGSEHTGGEQHVDDFVDILLHLKASHEFDHLTPVHIKAILQDMLLAGVETSSTTMEWIMAELVKHPREMEKVQEEVRRVVGPGKERVEMEEIELMEYFKCVVKETLRLHPPFPFLLPRQTLDTDTHIVGYDVPRHTKVLVNAWAIHRDPATWDRPHDFIPERFLENPLHFKPRDTFHYIPFGFGRRDCPGMALGTVNVQHLIANLLYAFDWTLPADNGIDGDPQKFDMTESYGITVGKKIPLLLIPKPYHPSA